MKFQVLGLAICLVMGVESQAQMGECDKTGQDGVAASSRSSAQTSSSSRRSARRSTASQARVPSRVALPERAKPRVPQIPLPEIPQNTGSSSSNVITIDGSSNNNSSGSNTVIQINGRTLTEAQAQACLEPLQAELQKIMSQVKAACASAPTGMKMPGMIPFSAECQNALNSIPQINASFEQALEACLNEVE